MQFGVVGDHPDGLLMAQALAKAGCRLAGYAGPPAGASWLSERGFNPNTHRDPEELFALGTVDLIVVGDDLEHRPQMLRRAMQSDKHVLCVHPADVLPDVTYEMAMIQQENRRLLLPLLPERLSPAVRRARELLKSGTVGPLQVIEATWRLRAGGYRTWDDHPLPRLWDVLRALAGEVRDVSALAQDVESLQPDHPVTLTGRFEAGGIFQVLVAPPAEDESPRLVLRCKDGRIELDGDSRGFVGLRAIRGEEVQAETWPDWEPWTGMAEAVAIGLSGRPTPVTWLDGTRCLELFEAARNSVKRKRVVAMLYEEFSEAANFKGIMATAGCLLIILLTGILVFMLVCGIPLMPWLPIVALPLLAIFLGMQALRWIVPDERGPANSSLATAREAATNQATAAENDVLDGQRQR